MRVHGRRTHRQMRSLAAISIALGVTFAATGLATASPRPSQFVIIKFVPSLDEVTLQIPTPPCRHGPPHCVWRLSVNEPFAPGAPSLGQATGTSGILVVTYPPMVCGTLQGDASVTLQADASVGGNVWRYKVGHRYTLPCVPNGQGASSPGTTGRDPTSVGTTQLPFTGPGADPASSSPIVTTSSISELPFTGVDLRPLALFGTALTLAGMLILITVEQRRRARMRLSRVSDWLLGQ